MVEIIKKGKIPGPKKYTCTCNKCYTIFSFTADEGSKRNFDERWGFDTNIYINCPLCQNSCYVPA